MPDHNHSHCHDDCHDHDHESSDLGPQDNLYTYVDRSNVVALNANGSGEIVIKPWNERLDETKVRIISCYWSYLVH